MKKGILPPVSKGRVFEDQVADLYRLMGYEIKQNVGVLGHQIDIILSYTMPGGIEANIAVECKYVEKGNLASGSCDKTIKIWDVNPRSTGFGTCGHIIMQQINCMGMKIKGIKGIKKERIEFLKERGAED
jgi:hypothetical protein